MTWNEKILLWLTKSSRWQWQCGQWLQSSKILVWDVKSQVGAKKRRNMWATPVPDFQTLYFPVDSNSTNLRSHESLLTASSRELKSGWDFTRQSWPRSPKVFCYQKQYCKRECNISRLYKDALSRVHQHSLGRKINSQIFSVHPRRCWEQVLSSEYFEKNCPIFFFTVVIGGDTYNKIVAWSDEVKLRIRFFTFWTGFSKVPIKFRCLWKHLLNKSFSLSESQENSPLKEFERITSPTICPKAWSAVPLSFWGLFVPFILKIG